MANSKYAMNLIGNWDTSQYEPLSNASQDIYKTNLKKLQNEYDALKQKLQSSGKEARSKYASGLADVINESFDRMSAYNSNLAQRGILNSGVSDLVERADIKSRGQDVQNLLGRLTGNVSENIENLANANKNYSESIGDIGSTLGSSLSKIGESEVSNRTNLANLVSNITESKASRGSSGSSKTSEGTELARRMYAFDILNDEDMSDVEKIRALISETDYSEPVANKLVKEYGTKKKSKKTDGLDITSQINLYDLLSNK